MTSERTVTFHAVFQTNELFKANIGAIYKRVKFALFFLCMLALLLILIVLVKLDESTLSNYGFSNIIFPLVLFFVVFFVVLPAGPWYAARKAVNDPRAKNGFQFTLSDNGGMTMQGSVAHIHLDWAAFLSARENKTSFQLFVTKGTFYFLPKRCFASPADIDLARDIIRTHIPKSKLLN
jgi:hypothetical protein